MQLVRGAPVRCPVGLVSDDPRLYSATRSGFFSGGWAASSVSVPSTPYWILTFWKARTVYSVVWFGVMWDFFFFFGFLRVLGKHLRIFYAGATVLHDTGHSELFVVLALVQFTGFRERRHQTRNYLPKYLTILLLHSEGKEEGAVRNKDVT